MSSADPAAAGACRWHVVRTRRKTPAHPVEAPGARGEGCGMFGRTARAASRLQLCPACRSRALGWMEADEAHDGAIKIEIRCGERGAWREAVCAEPRAWTGTRTHDRRLRGG